MYATTDLSLWYRNPWSATGPDRPTVVAIPSRNYDLSLYQPGDTAESRAKVRFSITDEASGETGTGLLEVWGLLSLESTGSNGIAFLNHFRYAYQFDLGGNRYDVRFRTAYSEYTEGVVADVSISDAPLTQTPEPGTLLMAGLGLASGGGLWLRRRRGQRPKA